MYPLYVYLVANTQNVDQKTLQKQFTKTLDEMKKRIDSRPTLFEQVQLEAVRNHQRKKIDMILQSAGVEVIDL